MTISLIVNESFLDPDRVGKIWTKSITASKVFRKQIEKRRKLLDRLNYVIKCLPRPDMSLETAIKNGHLNEMQVAKLYISLSDLLEFDHEYRRLILYLPFEFLPSRTWHPSEEALRQASDRFKQIYMRVWKDLLWVQDVRANFVDGDVLEVEQRVGDLPRVVKAAHLIPKLVEKGLMEVKDIVALMEESRDQILRESIAATFPVLSDLGLITEKEFELMENSNDYYISSIARIIQLNTFGENVIKSKKELRPITLSSIQENLSGKFSKIDAEEYEGITQRRKDWLIESKKQKIIKSLAEEISSGIIEHKIPHEQIIELLCQETDNAIIQTVIEGVRRAIEFTTLTNPDEALSIYKQYQNSLLKLWENDNTQINEALSKTFRRLFYLRIINKKQLEKLDIVLPELVMPFSTNLKQIPKELIDIDKITKLIKSDPELSRLIYPIVLIYGSRLKGYGKQYSDVDVGIFIRPETSFGDRAKIQRLLGNIFSQKIVKDGIIEFWLEETEEIFQVRNLAKIDSAVAESHWTHYLFASAWIGDEKKICELLEKLLVPYMFDTSKIIQGLNTRKTYLEVLETSLLQYRLMHNGYERFFPQFGGINTLHAKKIDGESMFWDSGYRQLATKLFVGKVFLPRIPIP